MALVTSGLGPSYGGVGVVAHAIAAALESEFDVTVWRHHPNWPSPMRQVGFVVTALGGYLRKPDGILFTHLDLARVATLLPSKARIPYGVFIYGVEVWGQLDRRRRVALENATSIFSISEFTVRKARAANPWLPEPRILWLGAASVATAPVAAKRPIVVMLGRMVRAEGYKGHDALIAAWPRVLASVPAAELVIVGDGDDRRRLEAKASPWQSVRFTGFLPDVDLQELLQSCAVLVSISTAEGFGLAAVEAAGYGVPVIALRGTVTEELFPGGCGHVLLDSTEESPLADALIGLLTDTERAGGIGRDGLRRVRESFTMDQFHGRLRAAVQPLARR